MDEKISQQFAQNSSAPTNAVSSENYANSDGSSAANDFLAILAGAQSLVANTAQDLASAGSAGSAGSPYAASVSADSASATSSSAASAASSSAASSSATQENGEEKRRHHLWHRLSSKQDSGKSSAKKNNAAPHFTPLPTAPKPIDLGIFDTRDGQVFDATMRLRLHTIIATCLMNGIADSRVDAFMHLLQWPDSPKVVVIAGTFGATITPDNGPNPKPAPTLPPDNTDALRRNIWPQLGSCNAYDAIIERAQSSALKRIAGPIAGPIAGYWGAMQAFGEAAEGNTTEGNTTEGNANFAAPSHIVILAVRENPSDQALEKICQVFAPSKKPICVSAVVEGSKQIAAAVTATIASIAVAPAVKHLPQIIHTDDVLPERALIGDTTAFETLYYKVYRSLAPYSHDDPTLPTIDMFLRFGGALDQTAHELNVHPNTVRYRLRKVAQTTGWDATDPRAAYVLQTAITIGRIRDSH